MNTTTPESRWRHVPHLARDIALLLLVLLTCNSALAKVSLRDPLPIELEALQEPRRVIAELPDLQAEAVRAQDQERLALLYLAEANACRVIANWICQRDAGERAVLTADQPTLVDLRIRGLIAQARGQISLGDFSRGERTLADAELLLDQVDAPALASDVYLGYSTLSSRIGKHSLSAEYAMRGLDVLAPGVAVPMQIRLLRNAAEARIRLQQLPEAREALRRAEALLPDIDDPKLHAEVRLESARLAHSEGNTALQQEEGEAILQLSQRLRNTQLRGLGLEVLGLAALQAGDVPSGIEQLQDAAAAFRQLGLDRDEHRVLAGLLHQPKLGEHSVALIERFIELNDQIELSERAVAADNFEDRLRYAEQELVLQQLESDRKLQVERSENLVARTNYLFTVLALSVLLLLSLVFLYFSQRRSGERLRDAVIFRQRALVQTSHELRGPLTGIIGLAEQLQQTRPDGRQLKMINSLRGAAQQLLQLAQDLLDRGRLEAGRLSLHPHPAQLRELVEQLRSLHQPIARELGLTLTLDVADTVPEGVLLDEVRLTQVLGNLLTNALKFTRHGEVSLEIRAEVAAGPNFTRLHFCVEDTGPGMSADELKQLFKPFSKLRAGQLHRSGAGLGLSISHELVALMGGELIAHSQPEVGTRFEFAITVEKIDPAAQSAHPAINSTDIDDGDEALEQLLPVSALLLDDDEDVLSIHEAILEQLGARTTICENPADALHQAEASPHDLLLVDFELSEVGDSLALLSQRHRFAGDPRVAVVSGHPAPEHLPEHVDEWLQKPVSMARWAILLATVRSSKAAVGSTG